MVPLFENEAVSVKSCVARTAAIRSMNRATARNVGAINCSH